MKPSPSARAPAAGTEGDSPALPSTPWAELDPGEQGTERFDRLGNRVLEDSSDEEEREREARDEVLDDEHTEVTPVLHHLLQSTRPCAFVQLVQSTPYK